MFSHYFVKCKRSKMTRYAAISIKPYRVQFSHTFNQLLILSQNLLKTSTSDMHTSSESRVQLVIVAGKFFIFQQDSAYPHSVRTHCLVSEAATTRVHITTSNSPYLNQVAYTICGNISGMSTSCVFKMSMN